MRKASQLNRVMKRAIQGVSRKLVLNVNRRLAENTPIDTGWARSNWIPSVDRPNEGVAGTRENVVLDAATAGVSEIKGWDLFRGQAFITNNVPYINDLNAGFSPQTPPGFVQESIESAISGLNNVVLR